MITAAIEKILSLSTPLTIRVDEREYATTRMDLITPPNPDEIRVNTLTGLVDYVKTNRDNLDLSTMLCHVKNHKEVVLFSALDKTCMTRNQYLSAAYTGPDNLKFGRFLNQDDFSIMLQSAFVEYADSESLSATDRGLVLKYASNVKEVAEAIFSDDGITQTVTARAGIAKVEEKALPNPVILRPYRTFNEVAQPASSFVFRAESGPHFALFEADGGIWKHEAMKGIKEYLEFELADTGMQIIA